MRRHTRHCLWGAICTFLLSYAAHAEHSIEPTTGSWTAQWIWEPGDGDENSWVSFRKAFSLNAVPFEAITRISADSKYWLYINGEMVVREGGLKRGPTPEDSFYDEVDLASYLVEGSNTIAVLVWYFGRSGYSHRDSGKGGLLFEGDFSEKIIISDGSWRVRRHPAYGETGSPRSSFRLPEQNVRFDATNDMPGWTEPGYDDSHSPWQSATEKGRPPVGPWNQLYQRSIPQWKDYGLRHYQQITMAGSVQTLPFTSVGRTIRGYMPYNGQVHPYIKLETTSGHVIDIRTDHYEVIRLGQTGINYIIRAEYRTKSGVQEFEMPAWINGQVVEYRMPSGIRILELKYRETGYDTEFSGIFQTNDPELNILWEKARRTIYVTTRDTFMETAGRERKAATADNTLGLLSALYAFDRSIYRMADAFYPPYIAYARSDGSFPNTAPGDWDSELPIQNLHMVGELGLWQYYLHSGNTALLYRMYDFILRYLKLWDLRSNGQVRHRNGDWDWFDWGDNIDEPVLENAWYYLAMQGMKKVAIAIGRDDDIEFYDNRMSSIRTAVLRDFWDGGGFRSPDHTGPYDDRANSMAVLCRFLPEDAESTMRHLLLRERNSSPYGENMVLESLFSLNASGAAILRIKERYNGMINSSLTTLSEFWDQSHMSLNHPFASGTLRILSSYVAGISPIAPGFIFYQIRPQPESLTDVVARIETLHGFLSMRYEDREDHVMLYSSGIPGLEGGRLCIPKRGSYHDITANGQTVWLEGELVPQEGIFFAEEQPEHFCFDVDDRPWTLMANNVTLPVELVAFESEFTGKNIELFWKTEGETDNAGFEIELRKPASGDWEVAGFVEGTGTTNEPQFYTFEIPEPFPGLYQIRLKQIDFDGAFSYSTVLTQEVPLLHEIEVEPLYPAPARYYSNFTFMVQRSQSYKIELFDVTGRKLHRLSEGYLEAGQRKSHRIDTTELPAGMYILQTSGPHFRINTPLIVAQ